ncbi:MAG TPA: M20 family peptidase [Permianibacter sp.]|nr:M20 family peptidase [Permianibacter sp.]
MNHASSKVFARYSRRLLRALALLLAVAVALLLIAAINTALTPSRQPQVTAMDGAALSTPAQLQQAAARLAAAIRKTTVSSQTDPALNREQFLALHAQFEQDYPLLHQHLQREIIGDYSLLYRWPGQDEQAAAIVLMAHMDVVPIAPGTDEQWQVPPFAGVVQDGFVWGRGAWDDKGNLIAQLEAVEALLASGFVPKRTVYLVYGADEEVGGDRGAKAIATLLQQRGVRAEFVLDEGMLITDGMIAGLSAPAALIGVAEKGYLSVNVQLRTTPGHSSMPPTNGAGAIEQLLKILQRLQQQPFPARIEGVAREMFETLGPEMHGMSRLALTNLWLFEPLVKAQLAQAPGTNAMLRTTTAFTMINAGNKDNVLPGEANATINFRLLPGTRRDDVLAHVAQQANAVVDEQAYTLTALPHGSEPSPVSATASRGYQWIARSLRELQPELLVAPGLMLGASDSRHFSVISEQIFRFSPIRAKPDDLARFHGSNERLSLADLELMLRFYRRLLEQAAGQ